MRRTNIAESKHIVIVFMMREMVSFECDAFFGKCLEEIVTDLYAFNEYLILLCDELPNN